MSHVADRLDLFISKAPFEKNANECLLINISYIKLSNQYFLINIVLYRSRNQNYRGPSEWLHLENGLFGCDLWLRGISVPFCARQSLHFDCLQSLNDLLYGHHNFVDK